MGEKNRHFKEENIQMANKHMKRHSISFVREIQIQTTVRSHYSLTRVAKIKNNDNTIYW